MTIDYVIGAVVGVLLGAVIGLLIGRRSGASEAELERIRREADAEVERAKKEAEIAAREEAVRLTAEAELDASRTRQEMSKREQRLLTKDEANEKHAAQLSKQDSQINRREKDLVRREARVAKQEADQERMLSEARRQLERAAGLSPNEALEQLVDEVREEARTQSIEQVQTIEAEARQLAEERARMIVASAIQRYASGHVAERTVSVVTLPSDEMKGRIIGREGRNIRAFEAASGCDLIVDDTPEAVVVSGFNPLRREIARIALEKLMADGRIHPSRIEEVVARVSQEMEQTVRQRGEAATFELEVAGLNPELVKALGRLHYRTSFAQNVLQHSIEVGFLTGVMAAELGMKEKQARRAGLLHDIGKSVEHEVEGPHAIVGAALCKKHGESKVIVNAVAAHHEDERARSVLAHLVAAANALSASRPGARREALASYIKRLEDLETLARQFKGVHRCYAIQAGQEIRVLVENAKLSDRDAGMLSREIAKKIEAELTYPGQIRVTVIRETRAVQFAR